MSLYDAKREKHLISFEQLRKTIRSWYFRWTSDFGDLTIFTFNKLDKTVLAIVQLDPAQSYVLCLPKKTTAS